MAIFLSDVMIRCPPANRKNIPDEALLFVFIDGDELTKWGILWRSLSKDLGGLARTSKCETVSASSYYNVEARV